MKPNTPSSSTYWNNKIQQYSSSTDGIENIAMISWKSYLADPPRSLSHQFIQHDTYAWHIFFLPAWRFFLVARKGMWGYATYDFPGDFKNQWLALDLNIILKLQSIRLRNWTGANPGSRLYPCMYLCSIPHPAGSVRHLWWQQVSTVGMASCVSSTQSWALNKRHA